MAEEKKQKSMQEDTLRSAITGAAAGTAAAFVTNPVSQVSNMKSSHPERFGNKKWPSVAKALWNTPAYTEDQKVVVKRISELEQAKKVHESVPSLTHTVTEIEHELGRNKAILKEMNPKTMKLKAFYSGFGTKALNNALFSAAMFGSIPMFKSLYDKASNKKINFKVENDTNE